MPSCSPVHAHLYTHMHRYAELLAHHAALALAIGAVDPRLLVILLQRMLLIDGANSTMPRWGHPAVIALATLEKLLLKNPVVSSVRGGGAKSASDKQIGKLRLRHETFTKIVDTVHHMSRICMWSKHLRENAQKNSQWMLNVQLAHGALRCLRLLWPECAPDECFLALGLEPGATFDAAKDAFVCKEREHLERCNVCKEHSHSSERCDDEQWAMIKRAYDAIKQNQPPIPLRELLPQLAKQLCGTQHLLHAAASELLAHVVARGAAEVLPDALSALTEAIKEVLTHTLHPHLPPPTSHLPPLTAHRSPLTAHRSPLTAHPHPHPHPHPHTRPGASIRESAADGGPPTSLASHLPLARQAASRR